eukprot:6082083-Prymnesium_polylepis.1
MRDGSQWSSGVRAGRAAALACVEVHMIVAHEVAPGCPRSEGGCPWPTADDVAKGRWPMADVVAKGGI